VSGTISLDLAACDAAAQRARHSAWIQMWAVISTAACIDLLKSDGQGLLVRIMADQALMLGWASADLLHWRLMRQTAEAVSAKVAEFASC
jgi:hypothetical protein